jgi:hypothetical protein
VSPNFKSGGIGWSVRKSQYFLKLVAQECPGLLQPSSQLFPLFHLLLPTAQAARLLVPSHIIRLSLPPMPRVLSTFRLTRIAQQNTIDLKSAHISSTSFLRSFATMGSIATQQQHPRANVHAAHHPTTASRHLTTTLVPFSFINWLS